MLSARGCTLLLAVTAFACGSGGASGDDLFSTSGGSRVATGGSANDGRGGTAAGGGTTATSGGSTSGGVDSSSGGAPGLGGASPAANGGASGGTVTTSGGAPSASGGRNGSAGALTSGGAGVANGGAGTAGASSGGAPVITGGTGGAVAAGGQLGSGGEVGSGGQQGAGGKGGASCEMLRMRLDTLLAEAQACDRNGGGSRFTKCSETVMTECGCSVPVNESSTAAIEEYRSALTQLKKACGMPNCPKIACLDPIPATCQGNGPGMGACAPSSTDTGPRTP